jgi:transglutaminase-like putative cysteine protease
MSTRVEIKHSTIYRYSAPVILYPQLVRLRPTPYCRTVINSYQLKIEPAQHFIHWQQDAFNNHIARLVFSQPVEMFSLEVRIQADIASVNPFDFFVDDCASHWPFSYSDELRLDLAPYLYIEKAGVKMQLLLDSFSQMTGGVVDFLLEVSQALVQRINYIERLDPGVQSCEESLSKSSGSCRDSAWLLVQTFRHLGLAARFVSGYSIQLSSGSGDQSSDAQSDSTDLHAWAEVFIPGGGWIGIDSTSGLLTGEGHIPLCSTREPLSAAPVSGNTGPAITELFFENTITRLTSG